MRRSSIWPCLSGHYLLARRLSPVDWEIARPGLDCLWPTRPSPAWGLLLSIAAQQQLDEEWCLDRLSRGDAALVILAGGIPAAMGLVTTSPFWVQEINQEFSPGSDGCYLYATYVSPAYRGQRIQRLVDGQRLDWAAARGKRRAYALVECDNRSSLRGHAASGFHIAARIDQARWPALTLSCARRTSPSSVGQVLPPPFQSFGPRLLRRKCEV